MTIVLRVVLFVACMFTFWYIVRKVRKSQVQVTDTVLWVLFVLFLLLMAIFPPIASLLAGLFGVQSTTNFIYLVVIFFLLIRVFSMCILISQLDNKIVQLSQQIALLHFEKPSERGDANSSENHL